MQLDRDFDGGDVSNEGWRNPQIQVLSLIIVECRQRFDFSVSRW
jgi:hypothetical protein